MVCTLAMFSCYYELQNVESPFGFTRTADCAFNTHAIKLFGPGKNNVEFC
jgi:hypothetical protein